MTAPRRAAAASPRLAIVAINHNSGPGLERCLRALAKDPPRTPHEVLAIENASTDGSADFLLGGKPIPRVRLLRPGRNLLYTGAIDLAVRETRADALLILNPDMVPEPGAVDALHDTLQADLGLGAAGGLCLRADGTPELRYLHRLPTVWAWYVAAFRSERHARRSRRYRDYTLAGLDLDQPVEVEQPAGGCLMARRAYLEGLGDGGYGLYFSDVEVARRIHAAGARALLVPQARFLHAHVPIRDTDPQRAWQISADYYVGALRYFRRWHGRRSAAWAWALIAWGLARRMLRKAAAVALRREPARALADHARVTSAVLRGKNPLLDGLDARRRTVG